MELSNEIAALRAEIAEVKELARQTRGLVGPFGVQMPDGSMLTQTIHGLIYYIDPTDTIMAPQMLIYRQWEAELTRLMDKLFSEATTFVDVGANFGYFTILGAKKLANRPGTCVIAIEPNPKLIKLLRRNAEINWSLAAIQIVDAAAGDKKGQATLFVPQEHGANGGLTSHAKADKHKVTMIRIDDIVPADRTVDVMKIDVEGHELRVLKGAAEVIKRSPGIKIILEWSPGQMQQAGIDPRKICEFMQEMALSPYQAHGSIGARMDWDDLVKSGYDNVLFMSEKRKF